MNKKALIYQKYIVKIPQKHLVYESNTCNKHCHCHVTHFWIMCCSCGLCVLKWFLRGKINLKWFSYSIECSINELKRFQILFWLKVNSFSLYSINFTWNVNGWNLGNFQNWNSDANLVLKDRNWLLEKPFLSKLSSKSSRLTCAVT